MSKRGWLALCLAFSSIAATAAERCTLSKFEIPVAMIGNRPVVKIGINGTQVPLLVDSGAFFSFLSPAAANQLKLKLSSLPFGMRIDGLAGEVEAQMTVVDRMQLQDGELPNIEFVVGGNEIGSGAMGILGRNILTMADIEYDLANGMIRIFFPKGDCGDTNFAYWAGDQPVVMLPLLRDLKRSPRAAIRAVAQINDKKIRVLFDTGATSMLALSAAQSAGIGKEQMKPAGRVRGGGRGSVDAWTAPLNTFVLGGETVSDIRIPVADFDLADADMLLGIDFFLAHRIYISKGQRRMYFTHNGGPVFALSATDMAKVRAAAASAPASGEASELDAAGYARRGAGSASRNDFIAALADLDQACALAPNEADYFVRRAVVHLALRQGREAMQDFDAALNLAPTHTEALLKRAGMRLRSASDAALADLQTLDNTLPPQAHARLEMARLYLRFDHTSEALVQLTHWIPTRDTDIELPQVLNLRCRLRLKLGIELDGALSDCDRAVDADDKNASFRVSRGFLRLRRGEVDKAQSDFDKALKLKPDDPWSLYGRGIARSRLGQAEAGRADLDAARKLRPQIDADAVKKGLPAPG